jgi:3-oxoacyl-(acyl-carrier-protein) synthase/SAM-dependent methyltransferase
VLCMRASREVELLMNCKQGEFVMLGGATATPTAFPADAIDIPRSRIVELQRAQAGNELNQWLARLLFAQIHRMARAGGQGMPQTEADLRKRCRIQDKYTPWLRESLNRLAEAGFVKLQGAAIQEWKTDDAAQTWAQWQAQKTQYSSNPETRALAALASECLEKLPEILQGTVLATDVIFPNASMDKVAGLYSNNPVADTFNEIVASAVLAYLQQRLSINPHARLRILEIGAGTGGTSAAVFARLKPYKQAIERYCYTDLSKAFFFHAERNYLPEHPYIACQRLDIEQPLEAQGIELGSYDLVIATNVLHATQDIRKTLRHAKSALRQDGFIILNEMCDRSLPTHLTFGLLDGWWLFQDAELRIPGCPGLYPQTWQRVLENEGFKSVLLPAGEARSLGNQVIVARSDGVIRLQVPIGESQGPVQTKVETAPKVAVKRANAPARPASTPPKDLAAHIRGSILECLSATLKMPVAGIESGIAFSDYGIDSILGVSFIDRVNARFGIALNTAIIFEYSSVERLARHVLEAYGRQIAAAVVDAPDATDAADDAPVEADAAALAAKPTTDAAADAGAAAVEVKPTAPAPAARGRDERTMEIAIIGMSGQFPKAGSVREFWDNLMRGVDGVEELPPRYLNQATHFSPIKQKGKTRCKWGGILADRDCFDPLFFNISPKEAESMNPHQRLVMQESWNALEDAGYDARQLAGSLTGIFIGAEPAGYIGDTFTGLSDAIIASRLSYALDFKGPAFVVNTGCSSSAVAIHLACESLRNRESNLVLAGGVNACMHQNIQVRLDEIEMLSPSGRCYTFDKAGDGTIISEGIGMLVLKRLDDAIADGDHIYGTICASGMNQDGASNGITAPNGAAQEQLITSVYDRYGIDPEAISYVEAHGTGTRLGDPVETNALVRAFRKYSSKVGWCAVGSAKSHIGHAAAAAGVIGIIKVLLSMQHRQLPKLLSFSNLNPLIEFDGSPFFITTETREWYSPDGVPRMAAINSFGHSGTNVHLVLKEHLPHASAPAVAVGDVPVPLSAKTSEQLRQRCEDLLRFLEAAPGTVDLASLAYTLQTGREAMEHRVAFVADSVSSLVSKLRSYLAAEQGIAGMWRGRAQRNDELPLGGGEPPSSLLEQWVRGRAVDWNSLWSTRPKRMSLPGYPFAKERYWIDTAFEAKAPAHAAELVPDPALEQIIDRIEDDTLAPQQAVQLLRRIV